MRSNPPTQCLVQLSHDMICSGGKDICLWDRNGRCSPSTTARSQLEESSEGGNSGTVTWFADSSVHSSYPVRVRSELAHVCVCNVRDTHSIS